VPRPLLASQLLRTLPLPLIVGGLALALTLSASARRGPTASSNTQPSIARALQNVERAVQPLIPDTRQALTHALAGRSR
jgi:hypothetical protein